MSRDTVKQEAKEFKFIFSSCIKTLIVIVDAIMFSELQIERRKLLIKGIDLDNKYEWHQQKAKKEKEKIKCNFF